MQCTACTRCSVPIQALWLQSLAWCHRSSHFSLRPAHARFDCTSHGQFVRHFCRAAVLCPSFAAWLGHRCRWVMASVRARVVSFLSTVREEVGEGAADNIPADEDLVDYVVGELSLVCDPPLRAGASHPLGPWHCWCWQALLKIALAKRSWWNACKPSSSPSKHFPATEGHRWPRRCLLKPHNRRSVQLGLVAPRIAPV